MAKKYFIYHINNEQVEFSDSFGNTHKISIPACVESQLIENFPDEDIVKITGFYEKKHEKLVIENGLWGGASIYRVSKLSGLSILRCLFFMCMLISVLLAPREIYIFSMKQPGGILFFCLSFLFIDTISQCYGYVSARKTLIMNALLMFVSGGLLYLTSLFHSSIMNASAYDQVVFSGMIKLCFINGFCSLVADNINAFIFYKVKFYMKNKALWIRSILSTTVSQFFFTVLWISFFKIDKLVRFDTYVFIMNNFTIKIVASIVLIPLLYLFVISLTRANKNFS